MTFEPSYEELIRLFEGKLFAPQIKAPEDFWSETRKEVIIKMVCAEIDRQCKRKAGPDVSFSVHQHSSQIESTDLLVFWSVY